MADIKTQLANHLPGGSFPHSVSRQRQNPVLHNAGISSATSTGPPEGDVPPAFGHGTGQGIRQNSQHINMTNYSLEDYPGLAGDLAGPYHMYPDEGPAQGTPEQFQAIFPENQGYQSFGYVPQGVVSGSARAALPGPSSGRPAPALGQPAAENLRRLASRYVNHPDSQVDMVRIEPGSTGRYKVVIVLEMSDFLWGHPSGCRDDPLPLITPED